MEAHEKRYSLGLTLISSNRTTNKEQNKASINHDESASEASQRQSHEPMLVISSKPETTAPAVQEIDDGLNSVEE